MKAEDMLGLDGNKALFFDDHYVAQKTGFALRLGEVCRDAQPVLTPDQPWEAGGLTGGSNCTVIDDHGRLRMWYVVPNPKPAAVAAAYLYFGSIFPWASISSSHRERI
jgi:hypothetical protein